MMSAMSDSYQKGLKLEDRITRLFKANGYDAKHNVKMMGRSGVMHQVDVYAEYKAPLHVSRIIIECKSYDKPIDKDIVMKLIHEVDDLGVDRGILVTTSYFTPDAVSTAEGYNVDLWDGAKLRELLKETLLEEITVPTNVFHAKPAFTFEESLKAVNRTLRGFFGKKGEVESSSILYYPFYELNIDAKIPEIKGLLIKKIEERVVNANILIEAVSGALCNYDPKDGIIAIIDLPALSDEEKRVFQTLLMRGPVTVSAMASLMNCSTAKARKILQGLVVKGVIEAVRVKRQMYYQTKIKIPDPSVFRTISLSLDVENGEPKEGIKISPILGMERVRAIIELLWSGNINEFKEFEGFLRSVERRSFAERTWETSFAEPIFEEARKRLKEEKDG